jgi:hypothetical protein
MAPPFPRSGPGESGSPTSQVVLRCYDFPSGSRLTITGSGYKRPHLADWSFLGPAGIDPTIRPKSNFGFRRGFIAVPTPAVNAIASGSQQGTMRAINPSDGTLAGRVRANYCSSAIYGSARPQRENDAGDGPISGISPPRRRGSDVTSTSRSVRSEPN